MALCECGCGQETTVYWGKPKRFITGHNTRLMVRPRKGAIVNCIRCGKTAYAPPCFANTRKFCSNECRDAYRAEKTGPEHPAWRRIELPCESCGVSVAVQPALTRKSVYCSNECARRGKGRKLARRNVKPGCWSDGRRLALERDHNACVFCGFKLALHVHHIHPRSKGGGHELENLITLCPNHHTLAHARQLTEREMRAAIARAPKKAPAKQLLLLG